ncbi:MAG: hypothetical protein C0490_24520 [Marivirga sp.]|nr:hypothetical protein [Marivirga sp.]
MLGWEIIIHTELSESINEGDWKLPSQENILANWRVGLGGDNWLNELVAADNAKCLGGSGYPIRYLTKLKHVLPIIHLGPPDHKGPLVIGENYVRESGWTSSRTINLEKLKHENPENMIVIDTWDES